MRIQVDDPKDLNGAILRTLDDPNEFKKERAEMREVLYPYWHESSKFSAKIIEEFVR